MTNLYKCPYCDKKIKTFRILKLHIMKNHIFYGYYCPYCIEFFGTFIALQNHLLKTNDKYHQNLCYLLTRGYYHRVDKKLFLANNDEL